MRTTRRRFIGIMAAAASLPLAKSTLAVPSQWRGRALGAEASILLHHPDHEMVEATIRAVMQEIRRLERIFSLFRADAAITRLNRDGRLSPAPPEMLELLATANWLSTLSEGAFDITVQPLWQAYAQGGDCRARVTKVQERVDWRGVLVDERTVRFAKPDMAITLNGIAQGYITDHVVDLLQQRGFTRALVHMGEFRGLGRREDGHSWQVGIGDPKTNDIIQLVDLTDHALATSSPFGTNLSCAGEAGAHHLFDPKTGRPATSWASVSVVAKRAVIADGLSTAVAVARPERALALLENGDAERAWLIGRDGGRLTFQPDQS